jgi:hypothetical protein
MTGLSRLERRLRGRRARNRQRFWPNITAHKGLAMLIRGQMDGIFGKAAEAAGVPASPAAPLPTLLIGGLLLLICP